MPLTRTTENPRRGRNRNGNAALEFVMVFPLLFLLWILLFHLGFVGVGQSEVIVEARYQAWRQPTSSQRSGPLTSRRFFFVNHRFSEGDAEVDVQVSPITDSFADPAKTQWVQTGTWDYLEIPSGKFPNFTLYAEVIASQNLGPLQDQANRAMLLYYRTLNSIDATRESLDSARHQFKQAQGSVSDNAIRGEIQSVMQDKLRDSIRIDQGLFQDIVGNGMQDFTNELLPEGINYDGNGFSVGF